MSVRLFVVMIVGVRVFVGVAMVVMIVVMFAGGDYVDLCSGEAAAHDLALLETSANVQRAGGFFKKGEGDAGVNQRAEQHVAANS
jgi:hypothetical protein